MAAGGRAEEEVGGLPLSPGDESGLLPGKSASDSDIMTKEIGTQDKRNLDRCFPWQDVSSVSLAHLVGQMLVLSCSQNHCWRT